MQTATQGEIRPVTDGSRSRRRFRRVWHVATLHIRDCLRTSEPAGRARAPIAIACVSIFVVAVGVRLLHWQDAYAPTPEKTRMVGTAQFYKTDARRILDEGGILFPNSVVDSGDARLIVHPPGYSIFIAAIYALSRNQDSMVILAQILCDALSAVLVLLIAEMLLNLAVGCIAAAFVALSPHFAYYSLKFSPDTFPVLPVLIAGLLVIKAGRQPRLITMVSAGAMVGLACWLRANFILLPLFLAVAVVLLVESGRRIRSAAALVGATILVVSPITIRNWIIYHHFIPISVDAGLALIEGIAAYDQDGRFGMPRFDGDASTKDAEWHNKPEYEHTLWSPDGIARDQYRFHRGLEVIRSNPLWFAGVMTRRAGFMLRYNDSGRADWPFNTSQVPVVNTSAAPMHTLSIADRKELAWSASAQELLTEGSIVSGDAVAWLESDDRFMRLTGDASEFGDQFASGVIPVKPRTDYVLTVGIDVEQGQTAAKMTSSDRRIALASAILSRDDEEKRPNRKSRSRVSDATAEPASQDRSGITQIEFASGDRNDVRLVVSNNGSASVRPITHLGRVELFDLGATPYLWTRYPRALIHGLQKNIFRTRVMLPLVIAGVLLLAAGGRWRALAILLAVPIYYLCVQSALTTEYRYILAIHYFLFIAAAATVYCVAFLIIRFIRLREWLRGLSARTHSQDLA